MAAHYETLLPHQIEAILRKSPIAYLPWGAHEWHGPHNPLGVDGIKAMGLAEALCDEVGGVVFPTVWCGSETMKLKGFPYTLDFELPVAAALARRHLEEIAKAGFKVIVIVLGHYARLHAESVREAVNAFNARTPGHKAWAVQDNEMTEAFGYPEDHGGTGETSYVMAFAPGAVDLSRLPADRPPDWERDGVSGEDPRRKASAERGKEATAVFVREAAKRVREMLAD